MRNVVRAETLIGRRLNYGSIRYLEDLISCKTKTSGFHEEWCPDGHYEGKRYHACRNRSCPLCRAHPTEVIADRWEEKFLDCDYRQIVFTCPRQLRNLYRYNKKAFADLMFKAVSAGLKELFPEWMGEDVMPGFIVVLHTHNRRLLLHPHLHVVITAGGVTGDGTWVDASNSFFIPHALLASKFRKHFARDLCAAIEAGTVVTPAGWRPIEKRIGYHYKWRAYVCRRQENERATLRYLIRYLRGGAVGNSRILDCDGKRVTIDLERKKHDDFFEPVDRTKREQKTLALPIDEFIRRLLEHVLPKRLHAMRTYGVFSGASSKHRYPLAREALRMGPRKPPKRTTFADLVRCPTCDKKLEMGQECPSPLRLHRRGWALVRRARAQAPPGALAA